MLCSLLLRYAISEYFFSHKLLRLFNLGFQLLLSEQIFQFIIYSKACYFDYIFRISVRFLYLFIFLFAFPFSSFLSLLL